MERDNGSKTDDTVDRIDASFKLIEFYPPISDQSFMQIAVVADFMVGFCDLLNDVGSVVDDPAGHEEGSRHCFVVKQLKDPPTLAP